MRDHAVRFGAGAWSVTYTNEWMYGQGDVGMTDVQVADLSFVSYPNPATDRITLAMDLEGTATCQVLDARGRVVLVRSLHSGAPIELAVDQLPAGCYTARINHAGGSRTSRFHVVR